MFNRPFSFNGRIKRTEYGISFIIRVAVYVFVRVMIEYRNGSDAYALLYIPLLWFLLAQGAKRCHDINKSGWWQLIPFYFLWLLFEPGYPGTNQYDTGYETYSYGAEDYEKPYMVDEQSPHEMPVAGNLNDGSLSS